LKNQNNKYKISAFAFVLVLTVSALLVAFPTVGAHDPPLTVPTWCYAAVTNDVIGVGQQVVIVYWVNAIPPTAQGAYGDRWTFRAEVTKPDGTKETLGPFTSDPVGGGWTNYTPDQVGTYTIVVHMDEHTITGLPDLTPSVIRSPASVNDTYLASTSDPVTFTAQEDSIEGWPEAPLPTNFWTRPLYGANRDWDVLAANWLAGAAQNVGPTILFNYGTAPESGHIMWATPMWAGGIMDARFGDIGYQTSHYEGLGFTPPIILNGKIYYNVQSLPREGWRVLDLYTGEELWFHNTTGPITGAIASGSSSGSIVGESLAFGQILDFECPNQHGGFPYLWSTSHPTEPNTWMMFDAETGNYMCSIANVSTPRGSVNVYGEDGSILYYNIANGRLTCWNTTQAIWWKPSWTSNQYWMWRPGLNVTYDGNNGYSLNVSIPDVQGSIQTVREDQYVIGGTAGSNNEQGITEGNLWALSLERGKEGTLLWNITFTPPSSAGGLSVSMGFVDPEDGVFIFWCRQLKQWYGYSLETGEQIWEGEPEIAWSFYNMGSSGTIYQGMLLSFGDGLAGGELRAYDVLTGEILWEYVPKQIGFESPYGVYPIAITCIADGKIYLVSGEHSPTQPLWRGSYLRCINASNGVELWKVLHWGAVTSMFPGQGMVKIADGFLVGLNFYDNQIYCYGKGPSSTTVTAPDTSIPLGEEVIIRGTVTDECAGAKKLIDEGKFKSVPAISDEDMSTWMEYLYMQQAKPKDAKGVTVKLTAIDPNGNFQDIGEVTTDLNGNFGKMWTPPVPGEYHVTATFEGSNSYWSSDATTYFGVTEAPSAAQPIEPEAPEEPTEEPTEPEEPEEPTEPEEPEEPTEPEPTEPAEAPLITTEIAIIIAVVVIAIIGIVAYWALRKRK
jgi:hypothetical protein